MKDGGRQRIARQCAGVQGGVGVLSCRRRASDGCIASKRTGEIS